MSEMEDLLSRQKAAFLGDMAPSHDVRRDRLDRIEAMVLRHEGEFATAISADFGNRSANETSMLEVTPLLGAIRHARRICANG